MMYFRNEDTLEEIFEKINASNDQSLELSIDVDSIVWQNSHNVTILHRFAKNRGKVLVIQKGSESSQPFEGQEPPFVDNDSEEEAAVVSSVDPVLPSKQESKKTFRLPRFWIVLIVIAVLLSIVGGVFGYVYYIAPTAEIHLVVAKKTVSKEFTVSLRTEQEGIDAKGKSLPGYVLEGEKSGSEDLTATGTKVVGERASGSVTILNWTDVVIELPVGHEVVVNANQEGAGFVYVTQSAVTVPPREVTSSGLGAKSTTAGSVTVSVIAEDVGEVFNLPEGLYLTVTNFKYSDEAVQATNNAGFNGGFTEEVTVAQQSDIDEGLQSLVSKLERELRSEFIEGAKYTLVDETVEIAVATSGASVDAGEEVESFTIAATVNGSAIGYDSNHLEQLVGELITESIPEGFELSEDNLMSKVHYAGKSAEGFVQVQVSVESLVLPVVEEASLKEQLSGVSTDRAQEIITNIPNVRQGSVDLQPPLPAILQHMPFDAAKITLTVDVE